MKEGPLIYPGMTARSLEGRPWWQSGSVADFVQKISEMRIEQLQALALDIKSAIAITNSHVADKNRESERRHAAARALTHMVERKRRLNAELALRSNKGERSNDMMQQWRKGMLDEAEQKVAAGDALGAVRTLVRLLKGVP